ncbi:MAG: hypothetical protein JW774_11470 [Candidatus Aureabacteria bacterium]|nr:hypothetical protein [Candidatus Auribacterota bacterium]
MIVNCHDLSLGLRNLLWDFGFKNAELAGFRNIVTKPLGRKYEGVTGKFVLFDDSYDNYFTITGSEKNLARGYHAVVVHKDHIYGHDPLLLSKYREFPVQDEV